MNSQERPYTQKDLEWLAMESKFLDRTDRRGTKIEDGIRETVIACNLLQLPTRQSCEGHVSWGRIAPWVDIQAPGKPKWRHYNEEEIYKEVASKYGITVEDVLSGEVEEADNEATLRAYEQDQTPEGVAWDNENFKLYERAKELLDEFYKDREVSENVRVIVEKGYDNVTLHNGGDDYDNYDQESYEKLTEEEKKQLAERLRHYQEEIKIFTEFLRQKFYEQF